jgi:hypothetical protein
MAGKREFMRAGTVANLMILFASPALAASSKLEGAGTALWIFLIVGAVIVLLQLIPAAILFFSIIGSASSVVFGKRKKPGEEVMLAATEPATTQG